MKACCDAATAMRHTTLPFATAAIATKDALAWILPPIFKLGQKAALKYKPCSMAHLYSLWDKHNHHQQRKLSTVIYLKFDANISRFHFIFKISIFQNTSQMLISCPRFSYEIFLSIGLYCLCLHLVFFSQKFFVLINHGLRHVEFLARWWHMTKKFSLHGMNIENKKSFWHYSSSSWYTLCMSVDDIKSSKVHSGSAPRWCTFKMPVLFFVCCCRYKCFALICPRPFLGHGTH